MYNVQDKQKIYCFKCNEPGYFAKYCRNLNDTEYIPKCSICKKN